MLFIETLEKEYRVYNRTTRKELVVMAASREGALLEASRMVYGYHYWDIHRIVAKPYGLVMGDLVAPKE